MLERNITKVYHTEAIVWTSLCMESISKIPRRSLTLPCVAAITLLTWLQSVPYNRTTS